MEATKNSFLFNIIRSANVSTWKRNVATNETDENKLSIIATTKKYRMKNFKELGSYISEKNIMGLIIANINGDNDLLRTIKNKAVAIREKDIEIAIDDEDYFQAEVTGSGKEVYLVSAVDEIFRCNCADYLYRCMNKKGESICKHIYRVIELYLGDYV